MAINQPNDINAGDAIAASPVQQNFETLYKAETGKLGLSNYDSQHAITGAHTAITGTSIDVSGECECGTLDVQGAGEFDGNVVITTGNLTISNGAVTITSGNLTMSSGDLAITGDSDFVGAISITGATVASGNLTVSGNVTVTGNITASGDVTCNGTITGKIAANSVTASDVLVAASVTIDKMAAVAQGASTAAGGFAISASCGAFSETSTKETDVTNLSVTLITTGRPIFIGLIPTVTSSLCQIYQIDPLSNITYGRYYFYRDATKIFNVACWNSSNGSNEKVGFIPGSFHLIDIPSAGSYTYKFSIETSATDIYVQHCKLIAYEL